MYPLITQSYWRDEAFSILLASRPLGEVILLSARDFTPPLYTILLKVWILIFGVSEFATRSLSLVWYLLLLAGIYSLLHTWARWHKRHAVIIVLVLALVHPLFIEYAFETRAYAMIACLAAWSYSFFLRRMWRWYAIVTLAGLMTHYFMIFVVLAQGLALSIEMAYHRFRAGRWVRVTPQHVASFLTPLAVFAMWIIYMLLNRDWSGSYGFWIPKPTLQHLITLPGLLVFGHDSFATFEFDLMPFTLLVYVLIAVAIATHTHMFRQRYLPLLLWAFMPGLLVWIYSRVATSLYLPRYLIVSGPGLLVLLFVSLRDMRTVVRWILLACIVFALVGYLTRIQDSFPGQGLFFETKENLKGKIGSLRTHGRSNEYLLVESELDYHVAQLYWHDPERVKIIGKTYEELPDYVGKVLIKRDALASPHSLYSGYILRTDRRIVPIQSYRPSE